MVKLSICDTLIILYLQHDIFGKMRYCYDGDYLFSRIKLYFLVSPFVLHKEVWGYLPSASEVWGKVIFVHFFVILFTGVCVWRGVVKGGVHGKEGGMHGWGGHAWPEGGAWRGLCMVGGMHGQGACVAEGHAWPGGHVRLRGMCGQGGMLCKGGCALQRVMCMVKGACVAKGGMCGKGEHVW